MADWQQAPAVNQGDATAPAWASAPAVDASGGQSKRSGQGAGASYTPAEAFKTIDDYVRGMADMFTFGFADEAAAGANTVTGMGEGSSYSENLAKERERDREGGIPRALGQATGAVALAVGTGGAATPGIAARAAPPTVKGLAMQGAKEGAVYGGLYGAGSAEGGAQARTEGALWGALLGSLTGAGTGAVAGKMMQSGKPAVPTASELKKLGGKSYDEAFGHGVVLSQSKFDEIADGMYKTVKSRGTNQKLTPNIYGALDEFDNLRGTTPTLQEMDVLRQTLKTAAGSTNKKERALANKLIDELDDILEKLNPSDVIAGNVAEATKALTAARDYWTRGSKGETIEKLIKRAETKAAMYSQSGMENALRAEFRRLALNEKQMRLFTENEQKAIRLVAEGAPITNVLRFIGKFAPRGLLTGAFQTGVTYANPLLGAGMLATSEAGRAGATALTKSAARSASELMRAGQAGIPGAPPLSQLQQNALRAALMSQSQQNVNSLNRLMAPNRGQ